MTKKAGMESWKRKRRQEYLERKEFRYYIFCEVLITVLCSLFKILCNQLFLICTALPKLIIESAPAKRYHVHRPAVPSNGVCSSERINTQTFLQCLHSRLCGINS